MSDGSITPGLFDGMGAFPGGRGEGGARQTILIRNHENREVDGEIRVATKPDLEYDEAAFGGNTKLVVARQLANSVVSGARSRMKCVASAAIVVSSPAHPSTPTNAVNPAIRSIAIGSTSG